MGHIEPMHVEDNVFINADQGILNKIKTVKDFL